MVLMFRYFYLLLLFIMTPVYTLGQELPIAPDWSKENLSNQWQACLVSWSNTEGTIQRRDQWTWKNDKKVENAAYTIINSYPYTLAENETSVVVSGKKYNFSLSRKTASDQWIIDTLTAKTQQTLKHSAIQFPSLSAEAPTDKEALSVCSQLAVGLQLDQNFIYLPSLWATDTLVIDQHKVIKVGEDNSHYIKFHCTVKSPHTYTWIAAPEDDFDIQGELWLVTDYFLISRANVTFNLKNNPWKLHQTCTYQTNAKGIPLPLDFYCRAELQTHIYEQTKHFEINTIDSVLPSRFTLSYYGFPEPDFSNHRDKRLRYILVTIAFGMIVFAITFKIIKRNRNK